MSSEMVIFHGLVDAIAQTHSELAMQATKAVNVSLTLRNWLRHCKRRASATPGAASSMAT